MTSRTSPCSPGSEELISQQNKQDSARLVRSNRTPTQTDSSDPGLEERFQDGPISGIYRQRTLDGELASTVRPSSVGDSHASRSVVPGSEKARRMTVISGRKCLESCGNSGPLGSLERMLLESSTWNSKLVVLTWKVKVIPSGRSLFQLAVSVHPTREQGSSLWPTPTAEDIMKPIRTLCPSEETLDHGIMLVAAVGDCLCENPIRMWPTMAACDAQGTGRLQPRKDRLNAGPQFLREAVTWDQIQQGLPNGGLNPQWVEWLQGFPIGWTDCDVSGMRLFRSKSIRSLRGLHRLRTAYRSR
jgi:hypothetical protein